MIRLDFRKSQNTQFTAIRTKGKHNKPKNILEVQLYSCAFFKFAFLVITYIINKKRQILYVQVVVIHFIY